MECSTMRFSFTTIPFKSTDHGARMIGSGTHENAASQSSSTDNADKIKNRHQYQIETRPKSIVLVEKSDAATVCFVIFTSVLLH